MFSGEETTFKVHKKMCPMSNQQCNGLKFTENGLQANPSRVLISEHKEGLRHVTQPNKSVTKETSKRTHFNTEVKETPKVGLKIVNFHVEPTEKVTKKMNAGFSNLRAVERAKLYLNTQEKNCVHDELYDAEIIRMKDNLERTKKSKETRKFLLESKTVQNRNEPSNKSMLTSPYEIPPPIIKHKNAKRIINPAKSDTQYKLNTTKRQLKRESNCIPYDTVFINSNYPSVPTVGKSNKIYRKKAYLANKPGIDADTLCYRKAMSKYRHSNACTRVGLDQIGGLNSSFNQSQQGIKYFYTPRIVRKTGITSPTQLW